MPEREMPSRGDGARGGDHGAKRQDQSPTGLDLARFSSWLRQFVAEPRGALTATQMEGGKSNLTYLVRDDADTWVVRRPPMGHVLATAHDMAREYRVLSALHGSRVPVPKTFALCEDLSVLGVPFYVMEWIDGVGYRHAEDLVQLGERRTRTIATNLMVTLARLHRTDPRSVGLDALGRPEGFAERQVRRWRKQFEASRSRELRNEDRLYRRLLEMIPGGSRAAIVHGDYRLDNVLIDSNDDIAAVIDWEMATLGDPLTDLALLVLYQRLSELISADAMSAPGFLHDQELLAAYLAQQPADLRDFGFYLGLAGYKFAAIREGIYFRHRQGQTVGPGFEDVGDVVDTILAVGLDVTTERF